MEWGGRLRTGTEAGPPTRGVKRGLQDLPAACLPASPSPRPIPAHPGRRAWLGAGGAAGRWCRTHLRGLSATALANPGACSLRSPGLWGGSSLHPRPLRPEAGQEAELAGDRR